jgi:hypothetical protein
MVLDARERQPASDTDDDVDQRNQPKTHLYDPLSHRRSRKGSAGLMKAALIEVLKSTINRRRRRRARPCAQPRMVHTIGLHFDGHPQANHKTSYGYRSDVLSRY